MQLVNSELRTTLQAHHPEALQELDNLADTIDNAGLDPALLDGCQSFFAATLRGEDWSAGREFSDLESDCLAVCEQFSVSVSSMSDDQLAALARHVSPDQLYNLMYAIYLIEMSERLNLTLRGVLQ